MQHATRACCPAGALERVFLGFYTPHAACHTRMLPRWGFRTGKSWFYTPHAACHTRMLPAGAKLQSWTTLIFNDSDD